MHITEFARFFALVSSCEILYNFGIISATKVQWNENTVKFLHTNIWINSFKFNEYNETKVKVKLTKQLKKVCKIHENINTEILWY